MYRFILPFVAVVLLIVVFSFGLFNDPRKLPSPFLGEQAPTFQLPSLTEPERMVGSADYAGKFAIVNVWATWCVGCRQEHQFLIDLAKTGAIPIYGINWRDNRQEALAWLRQLGDPYQFSAFDEDGRVGIDWGVYGAPETFLINADGIVLHKHLGPLTAAAWQNDFVPLMQSGGPSS
jgi:cytochrome c biogenesis protein CcmG/thiol:disulfide interchange protein DsbE